MTRAGSLNRICKVSSSFLDFQSVTPTFFKVPANDESSNFKDLLNKNDLDVHKVERIAMSIFCFFKSLKMRLPIVKISQNDTLIMKIVQKLVELN